jgi:hypothetical protein
MCSGETSDPAANDSNFHREIEFQSRMQQKENFVGQAKRLKEFSKEK